VATSHLLTAVAGVVIGASLREDAEPVFSAIAGGAAVGSALACAWAVRQDTPQWDKAMGLGAAYGATVGAGLLVLEMTGVR